MNHTTNNYHVSIAVDSRCDICVKSDRPLSLQEIKQKALEEFAFTDIRDLDPDIINFQAVNVTDSDGNLTDF